MVGHGGSSAGSYLADPTSPIPSHCASIVMTSTVRVNIPQDLCVGMHGSTSSLYHHQGLLSLCKKASDHHANLPLEMYSFTL